MHFTRYLTQNIQDDLNSRMVFLGGPRQVGKTTLAKNFLKSSKGYFSWDSLEDRSILQKHAIPSDLKLVVLDEVHKYLRWRMLVKGLYDKHRETMKIIVTGSARLDLFRKGGDSLFGRYHYLRMHPLSLNELHRDANKGDVDSLLKFGGFPEPFLRQDETFLRRWQLERISRVVNQDIRDLANLKEVSAIELLGSALPDRVSSLLSIKSLGEDLERSPHTIERWLQIFENMYVCFRVSPYGPPKIRAVKKQKKLYLWDWSQIDGAGARFENFVASHLLKFCHFQEDVLGLPTELRFLRDDAGREIDFVVLQKKKPLFAVECKTGEKQLNPAIPYFKARLNIPRFYQVHLGKKDVMPESNLRILPFSTFCKAEDIP